MGKIVAVANQKGGVGPVYKPGPNLSKPSPLRFSFGYRRDRAGSSALR